MDVADGYKWSRVPVSNYSFAYFILTYVWTASRVAQLRFTFHTSAPSHTPYILIEAARSSIITSTPSNVTFPEGSVVVPNGDNITEICGSSSERQDQIIAPVSDAVASEEFHAYFCVRFDQPALREDVGIIKNGTQVGTAEGEVTGSLLSAFAFFNGATVINARVGTSFISIDQARANIDNEIPDVISGLCHLEASLWSIKLNTSLYRRQ